ncbi:helix-turn-helix domain-containing protein [Metabacillus schmidteae]|uniref:helix-turn-helix domain-containing protein n=1 Tax=Metabacillus schmidteae TaxID=2730405 RepID=UPI00158F0966|nr:helix-turn-helix domain-containing protein [Metabacillus schmidteae]
MSELGNRLKQAREEKKMSLDELQEITKIQKRYLIGLEEGNYSMMPGKFYARAFMKQYAEAVDLDPEMLFEEYKNEVPTTYKEDVPEQLSRVKTHKELPKTASKFIEILPKLAVVAVIFIVAVLLWLWRQDATEKNTANEQSTDQTSEVEFEKIENTATNEEQEEQGPPAEENEKAVEEEAEEKEPETPAQTLTLKGAEGSKTTYELTGAEKFELEVIAKDRTWVGIKNGKGKSFFGAEIAKGNSEVHDFTAETEITVRVGNVPGTDLKVNGELVQYEDPKKTPQNITIIYTKE